MSRQIGTRLLCFVLSCCLSSAAADAAGYRVLKKIPIPYGEGTWDYATVDEPGRRLFVSHESQVEVLNADTGKFLGRIPDTKGAHAIVLVPEFKRGFITNGANATVTVFDYDTLKKLSDLPTGELPDGMVYDPFTKRAFSFNTVSRNSTVIDAAQARVMGTVDLDAKPEQAVADGSGHLYVALKDKGMVGRIDTQKLVVDQRWPVADCDRPTTAALDKKARRLFIGCRNLMLYVMNLDTGKVITQVPIGDNVDTTAFDPSTALIFSSTEDGIITVVHEDGPDSYRVVETVKTQAGSQTMALDLRTHHLFVPFGEVEKIQPTAPGGKVKKKVAANSFGILVLGK